MPAAQKTGGAMVTSGPLTRVDTVAANAMGTAVRGLDQIGGAGEYIYLTGVTGTVKGSWVTFDENGITALLAANAVGPVAVAMAVIDANTKFGWYCVRGAVDAMVAANTADNAKLGFETTAGNAGDGAAAGDAISGAVSRAATAGAAALTLCQIMYPSVNDTSA